MKTLAAHLILIMAFTVATRAAKADAAVEEHLGRVDFPNSCSTQVQASFNRGVALLHDFWYEEAERQFDDIAKVDPRCAMAHWGIAMSRFHEIWNRPDEATLAKGRADLAQANAHPAASARERAYIAALLKFYGPLHAKYLDRANAYAAAMAELYRRYSGDVDAGAFYALSLLASEDSDDTSLRLEHQAERVLQPLFASNPDNPGVVHYLIHACDTPSLAAAGLAAARRYGKIASSGAHAAHMPGHIFARLGLWQDDIDSNLASVADSKAAQAKHQSEGFDQMHADEFLLYAYLQSGQESRAKQVLDDNEQLVAHVQSMPEMAHGAMSGMFAIYRNEFPAFYYLELRDWKAAAALKSDPDANPRAQMLTLWARSVAHGHLKDTAAAHADLTQVDALIADLRKGDSAYMADSTGMQVVRGEILGWTAFADGDVDAAQRNLRQSADLQDKVGQGEVDIPAREMLADMLLAANQSTAALAEYERALKLSPNRFNGLFNAGQASEAIGDQPRAAAFYATLLQVTDNGAHSTRVEFQHVRDFNAPQAAAARSALRAQALAAASTLQGELRVPGLRHGVRVQRDQWGVAHIYAESEDDLFFAQGFVVAQDRLFQMELWKRAGQGRLAEILGPAAVQRDINARRLRYRGDMQAEYQSYAPDTQRILRAFTAGINAFIDAAETPGGKMPIEFKVAGFHPEHWHPEDCLNRLAAYSMMNNASEELLHAKLVSLLGAPAATELLHFDPAVALDPAAGLDFSGLSPDLLKNVVSGDVRIPFPATSLHESNNWTVSGSLTATGKPLLANDPHRIIANPSLRYMVHLVAPGWNVIGAGEPGLPGVAAGHNEHIAWGFTIFGMDQQDFYLETLNPNDATLYKTAHGWTKLKEIKETIAVRGAAPVSVTLQFTRHGPLLWQDERRALALRWVGAEPGTAGYLGSLSLDRAANWQEFEQAMPRWKVPTENIVYADRDGNIGEHSTGLVPLRKGFTGLLPLPGDGAFEWSGFVPNAELPHSFNPASDFIATANQKMIPEHYPYAVGFAWLPPTRFNRIHEVLQQAKDTNRKLSVADMESLQTDVVSLPARRLQALLRNADPSRSSSALLQDWDCALRTDSAAAAWYEVWATALRVEVTPLVVPEKARALLGRLDMDDVVNELAEARPAVFGTEAARARDALLLQTLAAARAQLIKLQGLDPAHWSWGALHAAHFRHSLDANADIAAVFDPAPVARPGDEETVQSTYSDGDSYDQAGGASYREIFDLSDWDNAVAINVPGQSGQPGAQHFDDLLPLWRDGRYFPLRYSKAAVDAVTRDVLTLQP
jgi:penicillin amidase